MKTLCRSPSDPKRCAKLSVDSFFFRLVLSFDSGSACLWEKDISSPSPSPSITFYVGDVQEASCFAWLFGVGIEWYSYSSLCGPATAGYA